MVKKPEINTKSGERLRELIKSLEMTQKEFAESVGITERTLTAYVNNTRRLTEYSAKIITEKYPCVRYEWLMGWDDYKTELMKNIAPKIFPVWKSLKKIDLFEKTLAAYGFEIILNTEGGEKFGNFLDMVGYDETMSALSNSEDKELVAMWDFFEKRLNSPIAYKLIHKKNGFIAYLSSKDRERYADEICDFIEFKIERLIQHKQEETNGKHTGTPG